MTNNVHCDEFADRLPDLLERAVDEPTRAVLESHALGCGECGSLLADLRKLRIEASNLPVLTPSRDLWSGIAERIDAPVIPLPTGEFAATRRRTMRWPRWASLAAAAVLLVALTSTSTYLLTVRGRVATVTQLASSAIPLARDSVKQALPVAQPASEHTVAARESDTAHARRVKSDPVVPSATRLASNSKPSAEQVYAGEISRLHAIVERRRAQLDPVTVSVIERNLKVIDEAIAQCKVALSKDPASRFLMESLNNALETKVNLLRTATMLPARS
jgi:Putative zinc-finger